MMRVILALLLMAGMARAGSDRPGDFDYYVMALSWSPSWCALEGDARGAAQCDPRRGHGFVLHGLWPQHETGWPAWCDSDARAPSRSEIRAMVPIMGSAGLVRYQWEKHGRCSGLAAGAYFDAARRAWARVRRPAALRQPDRPARLAPAEVEGAFLAANPGWTADMVTITCKNGHIQEARICLTKDLAPRPCGADVVRDCRARAARMPPVR